MSNQTLARWLGIEAWSPPARRLLSVIGISGLVTLVGALCLTVWQFRLQQDPTPVAHWMLLCALTVAVSGLSIRIAGTKGIITVSDTFLFTSVLIFGGPPSVVLGWLDGLAGTLRVTRKPASILYSSSMMALSMSVAASVLEALQGWPMRGHGDAQFINVLLPLMTVAVLHFFITTTGVSAMLSLRSGRPMLALWRHDCLLSALTYVTGAIAAALAYTLIQQLGMSAFFAVSPFILFIYWTYKVYSERLLEYSQSLERKVAERTTELEAANSRLRELDRLKTEFLNVVAHDLRTPLTSIKGYAQLMVLNPDRTENFSRYAKTIFEESDRLQELINNVLDLSKMESGNLQYEMYEQGIVELLEHFHGLFQSLALTNGLGLELRIHGTLPHIRADCKRLGQALCNLLNNAVKFNKPGGQVMLEARCVTQDGRPWVRVEVSDEGPGVPPEWRERIFEKYHTVQQQTHKAKEGTGLGLPIARQIVESHGGQIGVEPRSGEGSTFWFMLPGVERGAADAQAAAGADVTRPRDAAASQAATPPAAGVQPSRSHQELAVPLCSVPGA